MMSKALSDGGTLFYTDFIFQFHTEELMLVSEVCGVETCKKLNS